MTFRYLLRPAFRVAVSFFVLSALVMGVWTCARAGEKSRQKVLLIGVDAAEWSVLGSLLDQQKVPNFALLRAQGASGKLRSLEPLTKSPIIWASIATGKVPEKHGIADFFVKRAEKERAAAAAGKTAPTGAEGESPTTSNLWKARPIWDILGSLGKKVGVVGWWTTWPAQPVNGFMISDYVQYDDGSWPAKDSRRTYPASLDSLVTAYRLKPQDVSWAEIFQFVAPFDSTKATDRQKELVSDLRWIYAADVTFYRVAMHLYKAQRPEFMTVYFRGIDAVSHRYWDIDIPGTFNPPLNDAEYQWMKTLIPNYYIFTDRMIGDLLKVADPQTNVIVCSDHGFMGGGKGIQAHKLDGILFMKGPGVRKESNISGATVLDITPTVLTLFGLPTAQDMDGRPVEEALTSATMKKVARDTRLKTYETGHKAGGAGDQPIASPVDDELRERLRSLGYIQ